ncbi:MULTISPECIES: serine/threonine-protein kinase [unclassified Streptomyces]|uniref:serine/threonine-protein kinase n=1 Tax=unclassified Streptomyces TaxID=2593676 RepID=UPI000D365FB4|nr:MULTISPECIES: serine/threonine-protein kinase [unclassified Streptomyces]PTM85776.1 serine/threonine protein kinase [Streptomyces sp. VMFN-G11Ma]
MQSVERIGRYRLERRLGSGAFGTVWLARDDGLEAPVAVKVLADNWSHRMDVRERFLSEARMLRRAGSDRVVQVYDIGELPDGRPYFVMEYADGGTLAELPAGAVLPVSEALRLTALAARGAAALHAAGIVHRDIKPSNILLCASAGGTRRPDAADGVSRVLLADLGLAKSLAQASGLTQAAGSAGYRPPEQAEAGAGIDARADVYSLGAVGYHLVTGTVPGEPGRVVRPDRLRPDLPASVRRALMRALAPDRRRRWPDAESFAQELERLVASGLRPRRRRTALALTGAVAVVAAVGVTVPLMHGTSSAADVRVTDTTGRVVADVPGGWGGQLRDSGWDPRSLGLPPGHEPGLAVADRLTKWQDLGADVNGVFVGLSEHGDLTAAVNALTHPACHYDGSNGYTNPHWRGRLRSWSGCPGGGAVTEAALAPAHGSAQTRVYVQIRQNGRASATDRVLDSLSVSK